MIGEVMSKLGKLFGFDPDRHDGEIQEKKEEFHRELDKLEALVIETKLKGRDWGAINNKPIGDDMGSDRSNRIDSP